MRRVVVTGIGAVSCLGNSADEITDSLKNGRSGIVYNESFEEMGLRSLVSGSVNIDIKEHIDRKVLRFMGDAAAYAYIAMKWAIDDAGLEESDVSNPRTGLIASSGGASSENIITSADTLRSRGVKRIGPYMVPRTMSSSVSACLATPFRIKGVNYSITQDLVFAGGGEEEHWNLSSMFDAMGALSTKYNDEPTTASRPYDANRDGFVSASGSGMLVIEELEHAKARGAKIYAEIVGYGATSDGHDMVAPSGEGAYRCMEIAKATVDGDIDYVNTHGTSTPAGDIVEVQNIKKLFGEKMPKYGSSKSMCGHSLGATSAQEAIHCLLMLQHDFIAPSINVFDLDPALADMPPVTETIHDAGITTAMSNSFGFGGTNATLVFRKL
jgi:3-oxoacyl-[acyl-carrier-protein] synthase-1